jgi:hypothetical protein
MEQTEIEKAQAEVRNWLQWIRQSSAFTAPGASFSLTSAVSSLYGRWGDEHLSSERGLIEYALKFANNEADLASSDFFRGMPASPAYDNLRALEKQEAEKIQRHRAPLLSLLARIVANRKDAVRHFMPAAEKLLTHVWTVSEVRRNHLHAHRIIDDAAAFYAFIAILLLDEERGFELRQCELCRKFFLVRPTKGRRQKRFCGPEHLKESHDQAAAGRMRKIRAKKQRKHK